jgi:hypothetical protein
LADPRIPHWIALTQIVWWFRQILSLYYRRAVAPNPSRYPEIITTAMIFNSAILFFRCGLFPAAAARAFYGDGSLTGVAASGSGRENLKLHRSIDS